MPLRQRLAAWAACLLSVTFACLALTAQPQLQEVFVRDVRDGDTLEVVFSEGAREGLRYEGISAAELEACGGEEARSANEALVLQKSVWLEMNPQDGAFERERNRRLLAYVWLDPAGSDAVHVRLVEGGHALLDVRDVTDEAVNQDPTLFPVRYAAQILKAQISAVRARRGWWGDCDPYGAGDLAVAAVKYWGYVETVYIVNRGQEPRDLGPWTLEDASGSARNRLEFNRITGPSCLLPAGGLLRVHFGGGIPEAQRQTHTPCGEEEIDIYGTGRRLWNNDRDVAKLFDSEGQLVHQLVYPPFQD